MLKHLKRPAAFILVLLICLSAATALASGRDSALKAAFDAGALTVTETAFDWAAYRIATAEEMRLPAYVGEAETAEVTAYLEAQLASGAPRLLSLSPAGNTALVALGGCIYAMRDNVISPILPRWELGLKKEELRQEQHAEDGLLANLFGRDGAVWSHDGRYAVLTNYEMMVKGRSVDLILLDVFTGDAVFLESFDKNLFTRPGTYGGAVTNVCFSLDDSKLYYTLYARAEDRDELVWLCECELSTMETKRLRGSMVNVDKEDAYYPGLFMLDDGSLIALCQPAAGKLSRGVVRFRPSAGFKLLRALGAGRELYRIQGADELSLSSRKLVYSENSGWAAAVMTVPGSIKNVPGSVGLGVALAFRPETQSTGQPIVPSVLRCEAENGAPRLYMEPLDVQALRALDEEAALNWALSTVSVIDMCLSPDGYYALAAVNSRAIESVLMEAGLIDELSVNVYLALIDLERGEAKLLQDGRLPYLPDFSLEWNGDTVLYYNNKNGTLTLRVG
ncbi:MAG: hypothetical protein IKX84_03235 [Clostridia bacterium]|nr:hypothetical protein [Clostridia bacterium]